MHNTTQNDGSLMHILLYESKTFSQFRYQLSSRFTGIVFPSTSVTL